MTATPHIRHSALRQAGGGTADTGHKDCNRCVYRKQPAGHQALKFSTSTFFCRFAKRSILLSVSVRLAPFFLSFFKLRLEKELEHCSPFAIAGIEWIPRILKRSKRNVKAVGTGRNAPDEAPVQTFRGNARGNYTTPRVSVGVPSRWRGEHGRCEAG